MKFFFINSQVKFWIQKLCIRCSKNWKTCSWIRYYCDKLYIGILLEQLTVSWELFIAFNGKKQTMSHCTINVLRIVATPLEGGGGAIISKKTIEILKWIFICLKYSNLCLFVNTLLEMPFCKFSISSYFRPI